MRKIYFICLIAFCVSDLKIIIIMGKNKSLSDNERATIIKSASGGYC